MLMILVFYEQKVSEHPVMNDVVYSRRLSPRCVCCSALRLVQPVSARVGQGAPVPLGGGGVASGRGDVGGAPGALLRLLLLHDASRHAHATAEPRRGVGGRGAPPKVRHRQSVTPRGGAAPATGEYDIIVYQAIITRRRCLLQYCRKRDHLCSDAILKWVQSVTQTARVHLLETERGSKP